MSDDTKEKLKEVLDIVKTLNPDSPAKLQHELFSFIQKWWTEIGESQEIKEKVCEQLNLSPTMFGVYLTNPKLVFGMETAHKNVKEGWIQQYLEYTAGHEAPEDFHLWVAMTVVAMTMGRKCWWDNVYYKLFPNLFTVLVAPPGVGRKTTAISIGMKILDEACPEIRTILEKATPEFLGHILSKPTEAVGDKGLPKMEAKAEALLVAPELTTFLGREHYNESLIITLTRMYDCAEKMEINTLSRKTEVLKKVFVCLLGASTPEEISKAIPQSATGGGFMSRLNLIQKEASARNVPFAVPFDKTIRELLVTKLQDIHKNIEGEFTFTKGGKEWYSDYYVRWKGIIEHNTYSSANIERQADHLVKVAMIMAAAEGRTTLDEGLLQRAYNILDTALRNTGNVLRLIDANEKGKAAELVIAAVRFFGGDCSQSELIKKIYRKLDAKELRMIMETLNDANIIKSYISRVDGRTTRHRLLTVKEGS